MKHSTSGSRHNDPLLNAVKNNEIEKVNQLLKQLDASTKKSNKILRAAIHNKNNRILKRLLAHGFDPAIKDKRGWTALMWMLHQDQISWTCCKTLIEHMITTKKIHQKSDELGLTLKRAVYSGELSLFRSLIERGAYINYQVSHKAPFLDPNKTPPHLNRRSFLYDVIKTHNKDIMEMLIHYGIEINQKDLVNTLKKNLPDTPEINACLTLLSIYQTHTRTLLDACEQSDVSAVKEILRSSEGRVQVLSEYRKSQSPLTTALNKGNDTILDLLKDYIKRETFVAQYFFYQNKWCDFVHCHIEERWPKFYEKESNRACYYAIKADLPDKVDALLANTSVRSSQNEQYDRDELLKLILQSNNTCSLYFSLELLALGFIKKENFEEWVLNLFVTLWKETLSLCNKENTEERVLNRFFEYWKRKRSLSDDDFHEFFLRTAMKFSEHGYHNLALVFLSHIQTNYHEAKMLRFYHYLSMHGIQEIMPYPNTTNRHILHLTKNKSTNKIQENHLENLYKKIHEKSAIANLELFFIYLKKSISESPSQNNSPSQESRNKNLGRAAAYLINAATLKLKLIESNTATSLSDFIYKNTIIFLEHFSSQILKIDIKNEAEDVYLKQLTSLYQQNKIYLNLLSHFLTHLNSEKIKTLIDKIKGEEKDLSMLETLYKVYYFYGVKCCFLEKLNLMLNESTRFQIFKNVIYPNRNYNYEVQENWLDFFEKTKTLSGLLKYASFIKHKSDTRLTNTQRSSLLKHLKNKMLGRIIDDKIKPELISQDILTFLGQHRDRFHLFHQTTSLKIYRKIQAGKIEEAKQALMSFS